MESSHFVAVSSPWPLYKKLVFDYYLGPLTPKIYSPKFAKKSPLTRLLWQIDRTRLHLPWGFRGWPIQWNHAKCCGPDPCCHDNEIWARRAVQSPTGLSFITFWQKCMYCPKVDWAHTPLARSEELRQELGSCGWTSQRWRLDERRQRPVSSRYTSAWLTLVTLAETACRTNGVAVVKAMNAAAEVQRLVRMIVGETSGLTRVYMDMASSLTTTTPMSRSRSRTSSTAARAHPTSKPWLPY